MSCHVTQVLFQYSYILRQISHIERHDS